MLRNYLKASLRYIFRNKGYSFINILGLSAGLTCGIFIFLYVRYETSFDSHHRDADRIFRVIASVDSSTGTTFYAGTAHQLAPYVRDNLPQAEYIAKVTPAPTDQQVRSGDNVFLEASLDIPYVDEDLLKILSFDFLRGDPGTALAHPTSAVLTRETARKYFGDEEAMGRALSIAGEDFTVTGIIEDLPGNTIFRFKILRSWNALDPAWFYPRWMNFHMTFVKLAPGEDPNGFAELLTKAVLEHSRDELSARNMTYTSLLQPIRKVHLNSHQFVFERNAVGSKTYIYVFSVIGLFIMLIASINFVNLITARANTRAREVGIRKIVGARRRQLFSQFISESLLTTAFSSVTAIVMILMFLGTFNKLSQMRIDMADLVRSGFLLVLFSGTVMIGLAAGAYPAIVLSSFKPISALRDPFAKVSKGIALRKILVLGQFSLSIAMIAGSALFLLQLRHMKSRPLGFQKEDRLVVKMPETGVGRENYLSIKREFAAFAPVEGATFSSSVPGRSQSYARQWPTGQRETNSHDINWIDADGDFCSVYALEIVAGRNFNDAELAGMAGYPAILNETAVRTFGWLSPQEALGATFRDDDPKGIAVGVVKDFHFAGLQKAIESHVILLRGGYRYLTLKIRPGRISQTLPLIEEKFRTLFPGRVFEYFFLDEDFDRQYGKEEQTARIFGIFTFLGILISSLGLIGLAAFVAQQRTKEIGIRKVMGASVGSILGMLIREFLVLVLVANVIAWPACAVVMNRWLQSFAYRINIGAPAFLFAGLVGIVFALASISFQSLKAALRNPVDSLRLE